MVVDLQVRQSAARHPFKGLALRIIVTGSLAYGFDGRFGLVVGFGGWSPVRTRR